MPRASVADTLRAVNLVLLPLVARGLIVRRPPLVAGAEKLQLDRTAVRELQRLRRIYGPGPLRLALPRAVALILDPEDAKRVLAESPEPFRADSLEKRHALGHFQPYGVLASSGVPRDDRRAYNEQVLDTPAPVHCLADELLGKVVDEADTLLAVSEATGRLTWDDFMRHWFRMVRRVVFGDHAADDEEVTDLSGALRADGNWSYLKPKSRRKFERFEARLLHHLAKAEPGSLAGLMAQTPASPITVPHMQVPQWLFAFDPAGIATWRALVLLEGHPRQMERAVSEVADVDLRRPHELEFARACVLESLRLWPTTPGILRDTTEDTEWSTGTLPAGHGVVLFAPYLHRDDERLAFADRFEPSLWTGDHDPDAFPLVPFSAGPVVCPGRNLVLLLTSAMLGRLVQHHEYRLPARRHLDATEPMPAIYDPFRVTFAMRRRA
ncbi:cytochrome P450 [Egicoccus halophilus]|uniref:Cytochrome P450 n=1 Tax=Egicoccus halophilus TaxID=1670830 RepID=A0A8J3A9Z4_9ACTN|nr:cytochrome P450 [Egicoccus halophilus]